MAHRQQFEFMERVKNVFPQYFTGQPNNKFLTYLLMWVVEISNVTYGQTPLG